MNNHEHRRWPRIWVSIQQNALQDVAIPDIEINQFSGLQPALSNFRKHGAWPILVHARVWAVALRIKRKARSIGGVKNVPPTETTVARDSHDSVRDVIGGSEGSRRPLRSHANTVVADDGVRRATQEASKPVPATNNCAKLEVEPEPERNPTAL